VPQNFARGNDVNEEEMRLIRQIVRDEVFEILDVEVYDPLFQLLNPMEAGIVAFKQTLKKSRVGPWDPDRIKWVEAEGPSGLYQRSEDVTNPHFKALRKDLEQHGGKMRKSGFFIWLFNDGKAIGRKYVNSRRENDAHGKMQENLSNIKKAGQSLLTK